MKTRFNTLCIGILCLLISNFAKAQNSPQTALDPELIHQSKQIFYAESSPERMNANINFIKLLVKELKKPNSFNNHLDSLKTISILNSPDHTFRIFSWNLKYDDASYRFYGAIQMRTPDGSLKLIPLTDFSPKITNPDTITNHVKWYGAQYYQIIPIKSTVKPYYILLGWNGNTAAYNKKIIEILSFDKGEAVFGAPIIMDKGKAHNRIVFEYTKDASMYLKFDAKKNALIFDHLAPPNEKMKDLKSSYGPDLTFDSYEIINGKLRLKENVKMENDANNRDDEYIYPENKKRAQ